MATVWGGVQQILLGLVGYVFIVCFVNKQPRSLLKAYVPVVLIAVTYYGTGSSIAMMNYLALTVLVLRVAVERYGLVSRRSLSYFGPVVFFFGGVFVFGIMGVFFGPIALAIVVTSVDLIKDIYFKKSLK